MTSNSVSTPRSADDSLKKWRFSLIGNWLCVDFANTLGTPGSAREKLFGWADLVAFFVSAGIAPAAKRAQLLELEQLAPENVAAAFAAAIDLRRATQECLKALVSGQNPGPEFVGPVNRILRCTEGYDQLVEAEGLHGEPCWRIEFVLRERPLEWLLAAIARSAAELIAEEPAAPLRKCGNPSCVLYFYDTSRTGRRRWCSMAVCGNRHKAAAHARRAREAGGQGTN